MRHDLRYFAIVVLFLLFSPQILHAYVYQNVTTGGIKYLIKYYDDGTTIASCVGCVDNFNGIANILSSVEGVSVTSVSGFYDCAG